MKSIIPPAILTQHIAVLGKTRSGKTNTAKLIIEQVVAAGSRVCVLDPIKSDYWGLVSSANGKHAGLPFNIVGGPHGHLPLHKDAAKAIAGVVASGGLRLSVIDMEAFGPGQASPFFAAFAETLFREIKGVLYLVIDEAHLFAPKDGRGDESMATYWFKRLASGAGSKGIRLIVATQRVQELHNTVLSNCDTLFAHRVTFPEDQKRISDWVASQGEKDVVADVRRDLATLQRGECWMCSGEAGIFERRQLPLCSTYDNAQTPEDDSPRARVKTAPIDLGALNQLIGKAVEEAKANDPLALKVRIKELEAKLASRPNDAVQDGQRAAMQQLETRCREIQATHDDVVREAKSFLSGVPTTLDALKTRIEGAWTVLAGQTVSEQLAIVGLSRPAKVMRERMAASTPRAAAAAPAGDGSLPKMHRAFLTVLAQRGAMSKGRLLIFAGYVSSGPTSSAFAELNANGFMRSEGGTVEITESGRAALGPVDPLPTGKALRDKTLADLDRMESALLSVWFDAYPDAVTKGHVLERAGYVSSGPTSSAFARLTRRGFIVKSGAGFTAAKEFFES